MKQQTWWLTNNVCNQMPERSWNDHKPAWIMRGHFWGLLDFREDINIEIRYLQYLRLETEQWDAVRRLPGQ